MKNFKKTIKQTLFLIVLIVFTFWLIFRNQNFNEIYSIVINANIKYIILGIIAMFLYFTAEGYNLRRIMKAFGEEMSLIKAIKFTLIGFFFSSITPAATGGQPVEIFYMYKEKYTSAYSMTALLIQFCCFQTVTIIAGIIGAFINSSYIQGSIFYLLLIGITFNSIALIGTLIFLFSKKLTRFLLNIAIKILQVFKYKKIDSAKEKLENALKKYNDCSDFIKQHKSIFVKSLLVVVFQVLMYYSISFFVYKSFNLSGISMFKIITVQALLYSTVSSLPLPGAVGVSESAYLKIFSDIFGTSLINSAMIINRGINFYLYVIISTVVVIINILFQKKEQTEVEKNNEWKDTIIKFINKSYNMK